jgi:choline dehydrogenase-like flavoprotein
MDQVFDFVVVGGGSGGAVIAARLSKDPSCRVALIEASRASRAASASNCVEGEVAQPRRPSRWSACVSSA